MINRVRTPYINKIYAYPQLSKAARLKSLHLYKHMQIRRVYVLYTLLVGTGMLKVELGEILLSDSLMKLELP